MSLAPFKGRCPHCGHDSDFIAGGDTLDKWRLMTENNRLLSESLELRAQLASAQAENLRLRGALSQVLDVVDPSNYQHGCDCEPDVGYVCPA